MRIAFMAVALSLLTGTASAANFTYSFSANFSGQNTSDAVDGNSLVDLYAAFSTITGTIVFDDTALGISGADFADYAAPIITVDQFDMTQFERLPERTRIRNDSGFPFGDSVTTTFAGVPNTAPPGDYDTLSLQFVDPSETAFSDTGFPNLLDLGLFAITDLRISSTELFQSGSFIQKDESFFRFTDLTLIAPVPLPAGIWLLGGGLLGLGSLRTRGKRAG
ncbi:MAG: VPLPA-CTERM sorting domain-containing protein [Arenibacterium sp.]